MVKDSSRVVPEAVPAPSDQLLPFTSRVTARLEAAVPLWEGRWALPFSEGEVRDRSVLWAGVDLPKFSYSPYWDALTYFGWFLVLLLLQNTLCRLD